MVAIAVRAASNDSNPSGLHTASGPAISNLLSGGRKFRGANHSTIAKALQLPNASVGRWWALVQRIDPHHVNLADGTKKGGSKIC
tara:strand:+ start:696 stop:950 length:255 start_codon:yes stop_codon:yes gene_type:complete